jgi:cell division protein FtsI/penicillin-binding protein 2
LKQKEPRKDIRMRARSYIRTKMEKREDIFSGNENRVRILGIAVFFAGVILAGRLYFIQVLSYDKWTAIAKNQHNAFQELMADRGEIYMRDGDGRYPLAVNREYKMAYAVPRDVVDKEYTASELSRILSMDATLIRDKLNIPDDPFEIIKKRLTDEEVKQIKQAGLKGVALLPEKYRYYPAGELASQIVGFASLDGNGYGIEASKNSSLSGENGEVSQERDAGGRWIPLSDRSLISPKNGVSLVLTIDRVIQYETEKILYEAVESYGADKAQAIVVDPQTGAILAMASQPQFDPNNYSGVEDYSLFLNPSISLPYEPGSIMKPIVMASGIEEGKVNPNTEYVDTGLVKAGGYAIRNAEEKVYGRSTMMKVLEESINTGVIFVEKLLGHITFREYLERFGFGSKTDVDLPAELAGNTRNLQNIRSDTEFFTATFGQGITVTPLQMIMAYSVLANGGMLYKPQIIERIIHQDGSEEKIAPQVVRRVISEETSRTIGEMLRGVVVRGHGKRADVPGYLVAGKTGTAQVAKGNSKGYEDGMNIGSFAGYAPINDPRFVILVKIDNPKNVEWAESSAAPTFGKIMKFLLEYAKIKPTEEVKGR